MSNIQPRTKQSLTFAATLMVALISRSPAQTFTVLYNFTGGADGGTPYAGLVLDNSGNVYGTTSAGGAGLMGCISGCGTVFKVDSTNHETVLHNFGEVAFAALALDSAGNLYGTTPGFGAFGFGTVFKLTP